METVPLNSTLTTSDYTSLSNSASPNLTTPVLPLYVNLTDPGSPTVILTLAGINLLIGTAFASFETHTTLRGTPPAKRTRLFYFQTTCRRLFLVAVGSVFGAALLFIVIMRDYTTKTEGRGSDADLEAGMRAPPGRVISTVVPGTSRREGQDSGTEPLQVGGGLEGGEEEDNDKKSPPPPYAA
ncbi:hypothetical protein BJ170DRAFT_686408 [Xylariales sp. AK1849]|nr:hypothetical protein BJ170DRAFT_686408 [Xylariales sp. AK1849]